MTKIKKEVEKTSSKNNKRKSEFWKLLQEQLIEFGTLALKKGVTNLAISKINETETEIQKVVEEKIQKHSKRIIKTLIKILSYIIAVSFLSYGILEIILKNLNLELYTNLIFGLIFLIVALIINNKNN